MFYYATFLALILATSAYGGFPGSGNGGKGASSEKGPTEEEMRQLKYKDDAGQPMDESQMSEREFYRRLYELATPGYPIDPSEKYVSWGSGDYNVQFPSSTRSRDSEPGQRQSPEPPLNYLESIPYEDTKRWVEDHPIVVPERPTLSKSELYPNGLRWKDDYSRVVSEESKLYPNGLLWVEPVLLRNDDRANYGAVDSQMRRVTSASLVKMTDPRGHNVNPDDGTHSDLATKPDDAIWSKDGRGSRHQKRSQNTVNSILTSENKVSSTSNNKPFSDPTSEFQFYMRIYTEIQANVSDLLFPYFDTVLNNTNNSLIYDLVWSVYSNLVANGPYLWSPYSNGKHCFNWIERQILGNFTAGANVTHNETVTNIFADHAVLINIYNIVWGNATQIANTTGYLSQMDILRRFLNPVDRSIIPAIWNQTQKNYNTKYFTTYNQTMHL